MIRLVLDTSAVLAYAEGSIPVGELIGEVSDEGASFAVPLLCLAEAARDATASGLETLGVLTNLPAFLPVEVGDWREVGLYARVYGSVCAALVVVTALQHRAYALTKNASQYGNPSPPWVIELP